MREAAMVLGTAESVLVVFLCWVTVVLGQDDFAVSYNHQSVCGLRGSSVDLPCSYSYPSGFSATETLWYTGSDPVDLELDPEYSGRLEYGSDNERDCTLKIKDLRTNDSADYRFKFLTNQGETYSFEPAVTVSVTDLQVIVPPSTYGQNVTLTCSSTCPLTGNPSYIWYKNGGQEQTTSQQLSVKGYYADSYSCAIEGYPNLRSPTVCIWGESCLDVTYTHERACGLRGSSLDLPCSFRKPDWHPMIEKFWFTKSESAGSEPKDVTQSPEYASRVEYLGDKKKDCTLRIKNLRESDAAEYKFLFKTAHSAWGHVFPGTTLTLTDLQVKVTPATVIEGQSVTLTCSSTCSLTGEPSYIWFKNGHPLINPSTQDNQLFLDPVTREETGNYSCAVKDHEAVPSPEETLIIKGNSASLTVALATTVVVLLAVILLSVFFYFRRSKSRSEIPGDHTLETQIPLSSQPDSDGNTAVNIKSTDYNV